MGSLEVCLNQYAIIVSQRAESSRLWKQTVLDKVLSLLVMQDVALPATSTSTSEMAN